eukprot:377610_1
MSRMMIFIILALVLAHPQLPFHLHLYQISSRIHHTTTYVLCWILNLEFIGNSRHCSRILLHLWLFVYGLDHTHFRIRARATQYEECYIPPYFHTFHQYCFWRYPCTPHQHISFTLNQNATSSVSTTTYQVYPHPIADVPEIYYCSLDSYIDTPFTRNLLWRYTAPCSIPESTYAQHSCLCLSILLVCVGFVTYLAYSFCLVTAVSLSNNNMGNIWICLLYSS